MIYMERDIRACNYEELNAFVEEVLKKSKVGEKGEIETMLVFEALYNYLIGNCIKEDEVFSVRGEKAFGETRIKLGFDGSKVIDAFSENLQIAENVVMDTYADKIDHSYHSGRNYFTIIVKRSYSNSTMFCLIGFLVALLAYIPIHMMTDAQSREALRNEVIFPIEMIFTNIIVMVGAPVTFFSLLNHLTDAYILSERNSSLRRLQFKTFISSGIAVVLAAVWGIFFTNMMSGRFGLTDGIGEEASRLSISNALSNLAPSSIFTPFESISPFPLIILAILFTYALCSTGKYFDGMKKVIEGCYVLFSRMLTVVMFALPFFSFLAIMDVLLDMGPLAVLRIVILSVFTLISLAILALYYAVRLKAAGVSIAFFIRNIPGLLKENLSINSAIDAVPFNIRYCMTRYKMDRRKLEESLPVLSEINLDGNCFIIMLVTVFQVSVENIQISWIKIIGIAILIFFLSLGAPNQPGSCLIGVLIIINYLGLYDYICTAIYVEVIMGQLLNLVNVTGDIVTVATEDENIKQLKTIKKGTAV